MLVLTRKKNQQIKIGDNITITIVQVKGATVKVGIEAPTSIRVLRSELQVFDADEPAVESTSDTSAVETAPRGRNVSKASGSLRSAVLARRTAMPALACLGTSALEMALAVAE